MALTLTVECSKAEVQSAFRGKMVATVEGIDITDLVADVGKTDLLDEIGEDECMKYFDLVKNEEE
jgi:hypothetical protein